MAIMTIRVLLVESQPEDVLFMRDVLLEIESGRYWDIWRPLEILYASTVKGAMAIVARQSVDVILLNPDLSDSQGIATFRKIHRSAARIPIILLVGPEDLGMASRLVRDGAQDFLTKQSIDCAPLAHAIHNAIERQRLLSAAQAAANIDRLTGLIDRGDSWHSRIGTENSLRASAAA
jgi:DNA-binding NtrC family response regulator